MANYQNLHEWIALIEAVSGLAASSGVLAAGASAVAAANKWLIAKGVDIHAALNSQYGQAALNYAEQAVSSYVRKGGNPADQAFVDKTVSDIHLAMIDTHSGMAAKLGASHDDTGRIVTNKVEQAVKAAGVLAAPVVIPASSAVTPTVTAPVVAPSHRPRRRPQRRLRRRWIDRRDSHQRGLFRMVAR